MNNEQWTPGPWVPRYYDRVATPDDTDGTKSIAHIYNYREHPERLRANQSLVAAAPELFEALEYLLSRRVVEADVEYGTACKQAEHALAKARGETQ